jgi:hypothetical protein
MLRNVLEGSGRVRKVLEDSSNWWNVLERYLPPGLEIHWKVLEGSGRFHGCLLSKPRLPLRFATEICH